MMRVWRTFAGSLVLAVSAFGALSAIAQPAQPAASRTGRPAGPCDIYTAAGDPCVAAHSTTRALYASYSGPLYQVLRQTDGRTLDIGVVPASRHDTGGYADAAAQDAFCARTYCWITTIYDQSPKANHLTQAPRGGFSGPALGGFNNLPLADAAPVTLMGHKVYGTFIVPGMGLRNDSAKGTAVDDQAEGQYWVINGRHYNSGCCFDYGNAEIDSRDDDNGTMETTYFGDTLPWFHGTPPGPWVMTDQENNLVGCVTADGSKLCTTLPSITWRFVTAMAKGEPHHWTSLGGDAQHDRLAVMFDGPRVDATYDPMRKQGAILLGNGGDNSNGSQGTFYEGAMTAAGTFPTDATDQSVQANVVAAHYDVQRVSVTPATAAAMPPGLQTFTPGTTKPTAVTFTNTTGAPVTGLQLELRMPGKGWSAQADRGKNSSKSFPSVAPGESVIATFQVTSAAVASNGEFTGTATWKGTAGAHEETATEKVRNTSPVKINEFRIGDGFTANQTDTFIELYNAGTTDVDLSRWTLTAHPAQQAVAAAAQIPAGTRLPPGGFYLLGLANSGLAVPARAGDTVVHVRSTAGMSAGDTVVLGDGATAETHHVTAVGTPAADYTTLWQPLPDGPVVTFPAGTSNIPVQSVAGFTVGQKVALGYGTTYPVVGRGTEQYEVATVTAVGQPGTQAYLAVDAPTGATTLKVTSVENISKGDTIRLDVEGLGHGVETVTVADVGTPAHQTNLTAPAAVGATHIGVRRTEGIVAGDRLLVGTPATQETVTVAAVTRGGFDITPALNRAHIRDEWAVSPGTGLQLAAPLRFTHAANLPFSDRGTGITFTPATAFAHSSNEPVQALGTGLTLDGPLAAGHAIHTPVRDSAVRTAGYQGTPAPNQWFGGPELVTRALEFGRVLPVAAGSLILRDSTGAVADSVNYGRVVDPWAAEGYQAVSGNEHNGCYAPVPGAGVSTGRVQDGKDTDSNCADFSTESTTLLALPAAAGAMNLKVTDVRGFRSGQQIRVGQGADAETAVLSAVGTAGGTTLAAAAQVGGTALSVQNPMGLREGDTLTIGVGAGAETVVITAVSRRPSPSVSLARPLRLAHSAGTQVAGSGFTLATPLQKAHARLGRITGNPSTPGAPNRYTARAE